MKRLRKPCLNKKAWLTVLVSGMLSSGIVSAVEVVEAPVYSDTLTQRNINNVPEDSVTVTIPQTTCSGGELIRVDINYAEQMLSDLTFNNDGTTADLEVIVGHGDNPGIGDGVLSVKVGTLDAVEPDSLNFYQQSWANVANGENQTTVVPPVPVPAVISQTIVASPVNANDLADMGEPDGTNFPNGKTVTYSGGDVTQFVGNGLVDVHMTTAAAFTVGTGGSFSTTVITNATSRVQVVYTCDAPETVLTCSSILTAEGDTVTAILTGDESCHSVNISETISCDGDLGYDAASDPANCSITDNAGTLDLVCDSNDVIPANGSRGYRIIGAITGSEGSCSTQVTAMSCSTPAGQTLVADTANCNASITKSVPTPPIIPPGEVPIPTLSEWGLMLLAGLLGLVGIQASRRRV